MKSTLKFLSMAAMATSIMLTSCKDDDDNKPAGPAVTAFGAAKTNNFVYNLQAPAGSLGAFDLVAGTGVASSDAATKKDLQNTTQPTDLPGFKAELSSGNGAKFLEIDEETYNRATVQDADTAFMDQTTLTTLADIETGDFFAAKLRNTNQFALIKVTEVKEIPATTGDDRNKDYIKFDYKLGTK